MYTIYKTFFTPFWQKTFYHGLSNPKKINIFYGTRCTVLQSFHYWKNIGQFSSTVEKTSNNTSKEIAEKRFCNLCCEIKFLSKVTDWETANFEKISFFIENLLAGYYLPPCDTGWTIEHNVHLASYLKALIILWVTITTITHLFQVLNGSRYSRMDQVKFVEDRL